MYIYIKIATLLILVLGTILLVIWLFRPGANEAFKKNSLIALNNDKAILIKKKSKNGKGKKQKAKNSRT